MEEPGFMTGAIVEVMEEPDFMPGEVHTDSAQGNACGTRTCAE